MDYFPAPRGIWDANFVDKQHIDAEQMDRLDYLVAQLKRNGIYVDLNLHVSREFTAADGFPDTDKLPKQDKVVSWFEPRMIELQKNYARDLLAHTNPYTGLRWADDPAVALVEINNEDTLLGAAQSGEINELPDFYRGPLLRRWNTFLQARYGTTQKLLMAWNQNNPPLGENLLKTRGFSTAQPRGVWNSKPKRRPRARSKKWPRPQRLPVAPSI